MPAVAFVPDALPAPSGTPIVVPTPTGGTPSPSGEGCTVTISITYDAANVPDLSGLLVELGYPSSVSIPGFGGEQLVLDRVANLTGLGSGLFNVSDQDENAADLHVNIGLVSIGQSIPSGPYASVRFDCSSAPPAAAFSCTVAGSDTLGLDISPDLLTCSLAAAS
jgi:hypothetical protein